MPKPSASFVSTRVPSHGGGTDPGFGAAGEDDGTSLGDGSADADPDRLAQIVDNLVMNAVRHGAPPVQVQVQQRPGQVEISVSDGGSGVPDDIRPRLFERFATGPNPGGTGLGLFIVRELAGAHGGDVRYEPGARPAFVVTLPAVA